jgi:hypothetical protein
MPIAEDLCILYANWATSNNSSQFFWLVEA